MSVCSEVGIFGLFLCSLLPPLSFSLDSCLPIRGFWWIKSIKCLDLLECSVLCIRRMVVVIQFFYFSQCIF